MVVKTPKSQYELSSSHNYSGSRAAAIPLPAMIISRAVTAAPGSAMTTSDLAMINPGLAMIISLAFTAIPIPVMIIPRAVIAAQGSAMTTSNLAMINPSLAMIISRAVIAAPGSAMTTSDLAMINPGLAMTDCA